MRSLGLVALTAVLSTLCACGDYPPYVQSAAGIEALSTDETWLGARGLTDDDVPSLARLVNLHGLDFTAGWGRYEQKLTDRGVRDIAQLDLPHLTHLLLGRSNFITDAGVAHLGTMERLEYLDLRACAQLTDAGLGGLTLGLSVEHLNLMGNDGITDAGLLRLREIPGLQIVSLGGCSNITPEGVAALQAALPAARVTKRDEMWEYEAR